MGALLKQYLWVLDLAAILICSFFGAKLTSVYIGQKIAIEQKDAPLPNLRKSPVVPQNLPSFAEFKIILDRNIFDSTDRPKDASKEIVETKTKRKKGEPVKTALNLKILGLLIVGKGDDKRSSATIQSQQGLDTYAVGTKNGFAPNTELTRVQPDRIFFYNGEQLEYALVDGTLGPSIFGPPPTEPVKIAGASAPPATEPTPSAGEAIKQEGEGKFVIDQREVQNAVSRMEELFTEIRAVPNFAGGKVSGMKILSVKQGSIFDKLGLKRGDILEKINDMEIDVKKGFDIFSQLQNETHLKLDLIRNGAKQSFEYDIR